MFYPVDRGDLNPIYLMPYTFIWRWRQLISLKQLYLPTSLHSIKTQNITVIITNKTSDFPKTCCIPCVEADMWQNWGLPHGNWHQKVKDRDFLIRWIAEPCDIASECQSLQVWYVWCIVLIQVDCLLWGVPFVHKVFIHFLCYIYMTLYWAPCLLV